MGELSDKIAQEFLESDGFHLISLFLDSVLLFAYARTTGQYYNHTDYTVRAVRDVRHPDQKDLAILCLEAAGMICLDKKKKYIATDKGCSFLEEHYTGHDFWGVKIKHK